jgi:F0F1-type ATP synthase assembly protein I
MGGAKPWIMLVLGVLGFLLAVWIYDRLASAIASRPRDVDDAPDTERARRRRHVASGTAFALQQVFDPGIEHVIRAERDAQAEVADPGEGGDEPEASIESYRSDLLAAFDRVPIDPEELRRVLTSAAREGLDWRTLYEESVRLMLADRPYLAPSIPPPTRVAPRK